jgi:hypothetical protein
MASPTASADPEANAKAQLAADQSALTAMGDRIRQITLSFEQDSLRAASLAAQVSAESAAMRSLEGSLEQTTASLREEAILGYAGWANLPSTDTGGNVQDPAVRSVYVQLATGDVSEVIDRYRLLVRQVGAAQASLSSESKSAERAAQDTSAARKQAIEQAYALQTSVDQAQAHLAALVQASPSAGGASLQAGRSGPPTNGGLVTVVRAIVNQPTPTTSAVPSGRPPTTSPRGTTPPATAPPPTAPPPTTPPPTAPPTTTPTGSYKPLGGAWLELRMCESGDDYRTNTGNGYYGAYQFSEQTWLGLGLPGRPDLASPAVQDAAAVKLQSEVGWGAWPACSAALGL